MPFFHGQTGGGSLPCRICSLREEAAYQVGIPPGHPALAGREAVTGTVLEKLAQRRMGLRGRDSQFSAEYGVARYRLERKRKPQQHHQVLGAQHWLGIGREAGLRRASFVICE